MCASTRRIEVAHGSPWFAARLSALLGHEGYAVARLDSTGDVCRESGRPSPAAIVLHLSPTAEPRADDIVGALRTARGFAGPVIVLDRVRRAEGATQYLPRDVSPAQVAALVRRLVEAEP